jgi:hypothetical protein
MQKNINGSIGYTLLINKDIKILVFADMHSKLPYCDKDGIFISEWFKNKFKSKILLEEVPRTGTELKELWPSSPHTQKLKEVYLENSKIIQGVDIRPFLIHFSWELSFDSKSLAPDLNLKQYLSYINIFCNLKLPYFINELKYIYTKEYLLNNSLGLHYLKIKNYIKKYVKENNKYLNEKIKDLSNKHSSILENINEIISYIMEWYIIAKIYQSIEQGHKTIIIHAGLAHTSNIIDLLKNIYKYNIVSETGLTDLSDYDKVTNGCVYLPIDIDKQFGGNQFNIF